MLSRILDTIASASPVSGLSSTIVALSYRGYWRSRGKPSQPGIEQDAMASLEYARRMYPNSRIVLWGQSIGAGVATTLFDTHLRRLSETDSRPAIAGLILETPFKSLKAMLTELYPQKWLPYRYLYPFLRSHWDSGAALRSIASHPVGRSIPVLMVVAGKDELVSPEQSKELALMCRSAGMDVRSIIIPGALHVEAMNKSEGRKAIAEFVGSIAKRDVDHH